MKILAKLKNYFSSKFKNWKLNNLTNYFKTQQMAILNPDIKYFGVSNIPLEKEIKVLEIEPNEIIPKLEKLWFKKTFEGHIKDIYYDTDKKKFDKKNKKIRIRLKGDKFLVTFKKEKKKDTIKQAYEVEFPIPGGNQEIFEWLFNDFLWLKLKPFRAKKKYRISYQKNFDNGDIIEIDIDKYDKIPRLLEIEASNEKLLYEYIKKLNLEKHPIKTFGSRWLFKYYWIPYKNL